MQQKQFWVHIGSLTLMSPAQGQILRPAKTTVGVITLFSCFLVIFAQMPIYLFYCLLSSLLFIIRWICITRCENHLRYTRSEKRHQWRGLWAKCTRRERKRESERGTRCDGTDFWAPVIAAGNCLVETQRAREEFSVSCRKIFVSKLELFYTF